MPSPIAHSATGYIISRFLSTKYQQGRSFKNPILSLVFVVLVANAADIDFIFESITGENYHRGFTHSLVFCIVFSIFVAAIDFICRRKIIPQLFWLTLILYSSHLLLDFFTSGGKGMLLFWPFSPDFYKSSWSLFPPVHHELSLFAPVHLIFISFELAYSFVIYSMLHFWQKNKPKIEIN